MKTQVLKELLEEGYWKDDQHLNLTWDNGGSVYYKDKELFEIRTLESIKYEDCLGSVPYFIKRDNSWFDCTVQHFGELTKEDVIKAIGYFLNLLDCFLLFNVYLDNKQIAIFRPDYQCDREHLRIRKEYRK